MTVEVAEDVTTRQIKVVFRPLLLQIHVAGGSAPGGDAPLVAIDLPLFERIDVDSGTWTLESKTTTNASGDGESEGAMKKCRHLVVSMEKAEEALWPRIRD